MDLGQERVNVTLEKITKWDDSLYDFLKKEFPRYDTMIINPQIVFKINADESGLPHCVKSD